MPGKIRVLIVDDSAFVRQFLKGLLEADPAIEVVGVAGDAASAWEKVSRLAPDVLTLDVEMPGENGLSFLARLVRDRSIPVLMISSATDAGCAATFQALELGAIDFVAKPREDVRERLPELAEEIVSKVKAAAVSRARRFRGTHHAIPPRSLPRTGGVLMPRIVAVGASTGGTEAIREILSDLPLDFPGILIVQHMPARFTRAFADRLDTVCSIRVVEAEDGAAVRPGTALVAPGDNHLRVEAAADGFRVRLGHDAPIHHHRPSVDALFESVAQVVGSRAVGVLLTGMGDDGARGLLAMRRAGAATLAQDEASCVVFGMPRAAIALGAVEQVLPLAEIAGALSAIARG